MVVPDVGNIFRCLACRHTGLRLEAESYDCPHCGARFPVILGVPLLLNGVRVSRTGFSLPPEAVEPISAYFYDAPEGEQWAQLLCEVFSYRYEFADLTLTAENNYFFNRIGVLKDLVRPPVPTDAAVNAEVRYSIEHHLMGPTLPCGLVQTRNVRLRNTGSSVISSQGPRAVVLSYQWRDCRGNPLESPQATTALPIDLPPGRAITVPTLIHTPRQVGPCFVELMLHETGSGWLDGDSHWVGVRLVRPSAHAARPHWKRTALPVESYNYGADHQLGLQMVLRELDRTPGARLRILELGGGCEPMIRGLPHDMVNVDVDVQTLQIGAYRRRNDPHPIMHVAADVNDLPFANASFDAVVLFAALHHLPNPGQALAQLKRLLKPDGFLAVLCEPVGHYLNGVVGEEFHAELLHGINEQIFTEDEYEELFLRAGLVQSEVAIDGGSLKAILRPRTGAPSPLVSSEPRSIVHRLGQWLRRRAA